MLRADDFQIFLEVARRGRLIEAARVLKINHTTVGRHVSQLERSVPKDMTKTAHIEGVDTLVDSITEEEALTRTWAQDVYGSGIAGLRKLFA